MRPISGPLSCFKGSGDEASCHTNSQLLSRHCDCLVEGRQVLQIGNEDVTMPAEGLNYALGIDEVLVFARSGAR